MEPALLQPQVSSATAQFLVDNIHQRQIFPKSAVCTHLGHKAKPDVPGSESCQFSEVLFPGWDSQSGLGREGACLFTDGTVFAAR